MSCYIVQESDGVSRFTLEDGTGFLLLEFCPPPGGGDIVAGGPLRKGRRRRLEVIMDEDDWLAAVLNEL